MAKNWWFKFDFRVWRTDSALRRCSLETRGFWLECLCAMHDAEQYEITGTLDEVGWLIGCSPEIVAKCAIELQRTKTANVTLGNGSVTLVSRRMKRELNDREKTRLRVNKHRRNADVTELKRDRVISKSKSKEKEEELRVKSAVAEAAPPAQKKQRAVDPAHIQAEAGKDLGWQFDLLFSTFPDLVITPAHIGLITADVLDTDVDRKAWQSTLALYLGNYDPSKPAVYNPGRIGTVLKVFKDHKKDLNNGTKGNGTGSREHANTKALREWAELAESVGKAT